MPLIPLTINGIQVGTLHPISNFLKTACGSKTTGLEFRPINAPGVLSAWAKQFRRNYRDDAMIDAERGKLSRKEYLEKYVFPSSAPGFGPGIRSGDFAEILVADYLEWVLEFCVPRNRWSAKVIPDESTKGCDIIGYKTGTKPSPLDHLCVFEIKAKLSKKSEADRLQAAINDSSKDAVRLGESLAFLKRRYLLEKNGRQAEIERFQDPVDTPYKYTAGAVAVYSSDSFKEAEVTSANCTAIPGTKKGTTRAHPHLKNLELIVIKGDNLHDLANELYRRAADEA